MSSSAHTVADGVPPFASDAEEIAHLRRQRDELQTSNAALLERARAAETRQTSAEHAAESLSRGLASAQKALRGPRVAVAVLVRRGAQILVLRRADGSWCHPGGRLEPDESVEACAARELLEEAGIAVEVASVRRLDLWSHERGPAGAFLLVWCLVDVPVETNARLAEPDKFTTYGWVTKGDGWPWPMFMGSASLAARTAFDPWALPSGELDDTEREELVAMQATILYAVADEGWCAEHQQWKGAELAQKVQRWAEGRIAEIRGEAERS